MDSTVDQFLASLVDCKDSSSQITQIVAWVGGGEVDLPLSVARGLAAWPQTLPIEAGLRASMVDQILYRLSMKPGIEFAEAALVAWQSGATLYVPRERGRVMHYHQPRISTLLPEKQPPEVLEAVFERHGADVDVFEALTCLTQMLVLRGLTLAAAERFWESRVVSTGHPLAWLPLRLLPEEREIAWYLPAYLDHPTGTNEGIGNNATQRSPSDGRSVTWTAQLVSAADQPRLEAAVENWRRESNGQIETRIFHSDAPIAPEAIVPSVVLSLALASLSDIAESALRLLPIATDGAVETLFYPASTGGAYNDGHGGSYGRLRMWQTIGAMAGVPEDADIVAVVAEANRCAWFHFADTSPGRGGSRWFHDVAWDLGLMALRPDGRTLVVLAATDTD